MLKVFFYLKQYYNSIDCILLLLGLLMPSMVNYAFPLFCAINVLEKFYALLFIAGLCVITFLAIYGPTMVETSLRKCFADLIVSNVRKMQGSRKDLIALESVHVTGLLEKFVWSLTDLIKLSFTLILGLFILSTTSLISFIIVLHFAFVIFFILYYSRFFAFRIRRKIAKSSRILVKQIDRKQKSKSRKQSISLKMAILYLCRSQINMIIWRHSLSFLATVIGIGLIITGLILIAKGINTGIFIVLSGTIVMEKIHRLVDAFVVFQGETVHFEEIWKALKR